MGVPLAMLQVTVPTAGGVGPSLNAITTLSPGLTQLALGVLRALPQSAHTHEFAALAAGATAEHPGAFEMI